MGMGRLGVQTFRPRHGSMAARQPVAPLFSLQLHRLLPNSTCMAPALPPRPCLRAHVVFDEPELEAGGGALGGRQYHDLLQPLVPASNNVLYIAGLRQSWIQ